MICCCVLYCEDQYPAESRHIIFLMTLYTVSMTGFLLILLIECVVHTLFGEEGHGLSHGKQEGEVLYLAKLYYTILHCTVLYQALFICIVLYCSVLYYTL